ncbi:MAG: ABC transporter ATP-binding protein [Pseudomonadota bacterium]
MASDLPLLAARGLEVRIGPLQVCAGFDLRINAGECWGILGPNGSGKTTLLHTLAGVRPPAGGEIRAGATPLSRLEGRERARHLGLLLQNEDYRFPIRVLERVLAGRHPHLKALSWESAEDLRMAWEALDRVGLGGQGQRLASSLSGGERRRLQLAALWCQGPRVTLLDEPENDLDLRHQHRLLVDFIRAVTGEARAAVMVLHDPNLALRLCSHLLLLKDGGVLAQGPAAETVSDKSLSQLYDCPVMQVQGPDGPLFVAR